MELEVHRLHDEAHAALAEHALDAVPAREHGADLHAMLPRHERCPLPHRAAVVLQAIARRRIMCSLAR